MASSRNSFPRERTGAFDQAIEAFRGGCADAVHAWDAKAAVSADGELSVNGDVSISGTPSVNVNNTPLEVSTHFATESREDQIDLAAGEDDSFDVDPIAVSLMTLTGGGNEEMRVCLKNTVGVTRFCIGDNDVNIGPFIAIPFAQPVLAGEVFVHCGNESDTCHVILYLVGD